MKVNKGTFFQEDGFEIQIKPLTLKKGLTRVTLSRLPRGFETLFLLTHMLTYQ